MRFKFPLETVLKHRKRLEEAAQREFAEAQAAVDEALGRLEVMYKRLDEVREEIAHAQTTGGAHGLDFIRASEQFIAGHKIRIDLVRQEVRALLIIVEDKQEKLILAAQERKVLVKLKEKKWVEYKAWRSQLEDKEADDATMMRQSWGKK